MIKSLCETIREFYEFPTKESAVTFRPFKGTIDGLQHHHFLVFLKPEILSLEEGVNINAVLEFVFEHFRTWNVSIEGVRALSGMYLQKEKIISRNYETLHKISYQGWDACSEKVKSLLKEDFKDKLTPLTQILGGHQFLKAHPEITPFFLNEMVGSLTTKKLGSGAYGVFLEYKGNSYVLLNAFHPYQIESLTKPRSSIVALECYSNLSWAVLRREVIGTIYPQHAQKGSFRRELYEKKDFLGIKTVDISNNGLHVSPGPLEAAFQLLNFFVPGCEFINFSPMPSILKDLENSSLPRKYLFSLINNPHIEKESSSLESSLFEWTEDMDNKELCEFLKTQYNRKIS
jgi:hypothetical protein